MLGYKVQFFLEKPGERVPQGEIYVKSAIDKNFDIFYFVLLGLNTIKCIRQQILN